jgi:hypothetical protein
MHEHFRPPLATNEEVIMREFFILGSPGIEMQLIKELLQMSGKDFGEPFHARLHMLDSGSSEVGRHIDHPSLEFNEPTRVIFVGCSKGEGWDDVETSVITGDSGRATVLQLIDKYLADLQLSNELRRWIELVAADAVGYIPAMQALGATSDEIARVRALDRRAKYVTSAQEAEAERAVRSKEVQGRFTVVKIDHCNISTILDRLYPDLDELVIVVGENRTYIFGGDLECYDLREDYGGSVSSTGIPTQWLREEFLMWQGSRLPWIR